MAKITLEHQDEILTFPVDSILELKIQEVIIETVNPQRGDPWEKARFRFKILGIQALGDGGDPSPYEGWITRDIWGGVSWRLTDHPENKLRVWAEAIFRQELGPGFELDSDMFLQRNVRGVTGQYAAKTKDAHGNPFMRHQIDTLLPWNDAGQPPVQQQQQPTWQQQNLPPQPQPVAAGPRDPWAAVQNAAAQNTSTTVQQDPWALPNSPAQPDF